MLENMPCVESFKKGSVCVCLFVSFLLTSESTRQQSWYVLTSNVCLRDVLKSVGRGFMTFNMYVRKVLIDLPGT